MKSLHSPLFMNRISFERFIEAVFSFRKKRVEAHRALSSSAA
jgi:hypothetical protein